MKRNVLAAAVALFATSALAGTSYHFDTAITGPQQQTISGVVESENGKVRTNFTKGDGLLFKDNSFALVSGGDTMTVYDPTAKTYYELSLSQLAGDSGAQLERLRQMFQLTIENPKVSARPATDGETIQGFATKHTTVDASYDVSIDAMGQKMKMTTSQTIESWTTDKLPSSLINVMQLRGLKLGIPELDKMLAAQAATMHGFPLRQIIRTHVVQNGANIDVTQTTNVTDVSMKAAIPASEFVAPSGFTKVENPIEKMMNAVGAMKK